MDTLKALGPNLYYEPVMDNAVAGIFLNSEAGLQIVGQLAKLMTDPNPWLISQKALYEVYGKFYPAGTSYKNLEHIRQLVSTGEFKKYDYGNIENLRVYGQETPPYYDLSNISGFDIQLIAGETDQIDTPVDTIWLNSKLNEYGNKVDFKMYPHGHCGLLMPADSSSTTKDILHHILNLSQ